MNQTLFRLVTSVQQTDASEPLVVSPTIEEPVRFSDVQFVGEVDEQYHGFNYDYSNGELKLEFTCESAHELISNQYYTLGTDALIEFLVVNLDRAGVETISYRGKLDLETIVISPDRVAVSIIRFSIHEKIKDRWDTPIFLDKFRTLDDGFIVPPVPIELPMPGQTLRETGQLQRQGRFVENYPYPSPGVGGVYYVLPNMVQTKAELTPTVTPGELPGLGELKGVDSGLIGIFRSLFDHPLIKIDPAGSYALEIDWIINIRVTLTKPNLQIGKSKFGRLEMRPVLIVRQPARPDQIVNLAFQQNSNGFATSGEHGFKVNYSGSFDLPEGASVFLTVIVNCFALTSVKQIDFMVTTQNLRIRVDRKTRAVPTRTGAYPFPDALRYVVGSITNQTGHDTGTGNVYGSLIDKAGAAQAVDGEATEYALTTGGQLRGLKKAPSYSLKTLMETLSAHHAAGMLYETDPVTNVESIRIEAGPWFYRGSKILEIREVYEYREEPDLDLLHNEIEVGYEKFPDQGPGVAEEFNTVHTYQTPLVSRDDKLEIKCPLIAAGTAIEEARRLGIRKTDASGAVVSSETDAGAYDDDGFLLHVTSQQNPDTVQFIVRPPQPFPGVPYEAHYIRFSGGVISSLSSGTRLKEGDTLTFTGTGTANDGVQYIIIGVVGGQLGLLTAPAYEVFNQSPMVATGPVAVNWQLLSQPVKLRTTERLDVEGVTEPETVYNVELSPARMLRRHAGFINSGLAYKNATSELICTAYKHNGKLVTQVKTGVPSLPGDSDRQLVYETGNVALGAFDGFSRIFTPEKIFAKVRMSSKAINRLFDAMKNRLTEANENGEDPNLGYVEILNPDGELVSAFVRQVNYNPCSEVVDLVLRKRRPGAPAGGQNCSDFRDKTYNDFEDDPTLDPNRYRFCRFSDFR